MSIRLIGADRVATSLEQAATQLRDLSATDRKVSELILNTASPPRLTGALKASLRHVEGLGAVVGSSLPYSRYIEHRSRFLAHSVDRAWSQIVELYRRGVQEVCDRV